MLSQAQPDEDENAENGECAINMACTSTFMDSFFEQVSLLRLIVLVTFFIYKCSHFQVLWVFLNYSFTS